MFCSTPNQSRRIFLIDTNVRVVVLVLTFTEGSGACERCLNNSLELAHTFYIMLLVSTVQTNTNSCFGGCCLKTCIKLFTL